MADGIAVRHKLRVKQRGRVVVPERQDQSMWENRSGARPRSQKNSNWVICRIGYQICGGLPVK